MKLTRALFRAGIAGLILGYVTAGCGGSASGGPPRPKPQITSSGIPQPQQTGTGNLASLSFAVAVGEASHSATARRRADVSSASAGLSVTAFAASDSAHTHALATSSVDISPGSPACASRASFSRTCSIRISAPIGSDVFVLTAYDEAPVGGAIPPSAHALGVGQVPVVATAGATQTVAAVLAGSIAAIGVPQFISLPATGQHQVVGLVFDTRDATGSPIGGSTSNLYANPVHVTITEVGDSGHAALVLDGATVGQSASIARVGDTLAISYDGKGAVGYYFSVRFQASGIADSILRVGILELQKTTLAFTATDQLRTIDSVGPSEAGAPTAVKFGLNTGGCQPLLRVNDDGSLESNTLGNCPAAVGDGYTKFPITVTITDQPAHPLNLHIDEYRFSDPLEQPAGLSVFNGAMAYTSDRDLNRRDNGDPGAPYVGTVAANGATSILSGIGLNDPALGHDFRPTPLRMTTGGDGSLYFPGGYAPDPLGPGSGLTLIRVLPNGSVSYNTRDSYNTFSFNRYGASVAKGPDGNFWFTTGTGVEEVSPSLAFLKFIPVPGLQYVNDIAFDRYGTLWYINSDTYNEVFGKIDVVTGTSTSIPILAGYSPEWIVLTGDYLYFSGDGSFKRSIVRYSISSQQQTVIDLDAGFPGPMVADASGNVWFSECGSQRIAKIDAMTGTIYEERLPSADGFSRFDDRVRLSCTYGQMAVGPNNDVWFTEYYTAKIGVVRNP